MDIFKNLKASPNADSIYYADLFNINNKIWMITGNGKSNAAILATNQKKSDDLARDSVALIRETDTLFGCWDPGAVSTDLSLQTELHGLHKIDVIAYCLSATETKERYGERSYSIIEISSHNLALLLTHSSYPAFYSSIFFDNETHNWLNNPKRRLDRFIELTTGIKNTPFLAVPWMQQIEDKAFLYNNW